MKITVKGRRYFELIRGTDEEVALFEKMRVISVNSVRVHEEPPFSRQYLNADNVLILHFDDLDDPTSEYQQSGHFITADDVEAIAAFVEKPDPRPIMVHCTAGISRSGAIGACLNEYYNKKIAHHEEDHDAFWYNHPNISPNLYIMNLLWKRLKLEERG
jgi:predicted protein tyrosine phosphatase